MAAVLRAAGVDVEEGPDWWIVHGRGADGVRGGGLASSRLDHRIAMAFLVLGLASDEPVEVDSAEMIATSFPGFAATMRALGADIQ